MQMLGGARSPIGWSISFWRLNEKRRRGALLKPAKEAYMRPPPKRKGVAQAGALALLKLRSRDAGSTSWIPLAGSWKGVMGFLSKSDSFRRDRDMELR